MYYAINAIGWARNVVEGVRNNYTGCIQTGDSGGSVFNPVTGGVTAMGTISGYAQTIGSCFVYYTDIRVSYYGLPGSVRTQ